MRRYDDGARRSVRALGRAMPLAVGLTWLACADAPGVSSDASSSSRTDAATVARCARPAACDSADVVGSWRLVDACETTRDPPEECGLRTSIRTTGYAGAWVFDGARLTSDASYQRALVVDVPPACGVESCRALGEPQGLDCVQSAPSQCVCVVEREQLSVRGEYEVVGSRLTVTSSDVDVTYELCRSGPILHVQRELGADTFVFARDP